MIDDKKYNRTVTLNCPTCGGASFAPSLNEASDDSALTKCEGCGLEITKGDLIAANGANIQAHVGEIKQALVKDIEKQLKDAFKGFKRK